MQRCPRLEEEQKWDLMRGWVFLGTTERDWFGERRRRLTEEEEEEEEDETRKTVVGSSSEASCFIWSCFPLRDTL